MKPISGDQAIPAGRACKTLGKERDSNETTAQIKYAAGLKITLQRLQVQLRYGAAWFLVSPNMALVLPVGTMQYITQAEFYRLQGNKATQ